MSLLADITKLYVWAEQSKNILYGLEDDISTKTYFFETYRDHGNLVLVVDSLRSVMYNFIEAVQWFTYGATTPPEWYEWYSVHRGLYDQEPDLTWKKICEAWAADDFEGRAVTIAFIDRMRQLLWDEPFSAQWAARPEQEY